MQLRAELKEVRSYYAYCPNGRCWAVYHYTEYRGGTKEHPEEFTDGEKIDEYLTKEEARRMVFKLNGWKYKENYE